MRILKAIAEYDLVKAKKRKEKQTEQAKNQNLYSFDIDNIKSRYDIIQALELLSRKIAFDMTAEEVEKFERIIKKK